MEANRITGLEFKTVALIADLENDGGTERYANYVAATRAREQLLIAKPVSYTHLTLPTKPSV